MYHTFQYPAKWKRLTMYGGVWFIIASLVLQLLPGYSQYQLSFQENQSPFPHHNHSVKHDAKKATGLQDKTVVQNEEEEESLRKKKPEDSIFFQNNRNPLPEYVASNIKNRFLSFHTKANNRPVIAFFILYHSWKSDLG